MHGEICLLSCSVFLKNRMIKKGYNTLLDVLGASDKAIEKDLKINTAQIQEIRKESNYYLQKQYRPGISKDIICVSAGDSWLDSALNGGIKTQCIYQLLGFPSTGKTTFAVKVAVSWAREVSKVYYLDTEGSATAEAFKKNCDDLGVLSRILYSRVLTEAQLISFIGKLDVVDNALIIIDSINSLLKDLGSNDSNRPRFVCRLGIKLQEAAQSKNLCVVVTNTYSNSLKPVLGESWGCVVSKVLKFERNDLEFSISA
jgi:RecA/RadA recombinase